MAAKMVEKTGGDKVELRVSGTKVYLGDDEMVLNLSKDERDDPVHIDIGLNAWLSDLRGQRPVCGSARHPWPGV